MTGSARSRYILKPATIAEGPQIPRLGDPPIGVRAREGLLKQEVRMVVLRRPIRPQVVTLVDPAALSDGEADRKALGFVVKLLVKEVLEEGEPSKSEVLHACYDMTASKYPRCEIKRQIEDAVLADE